MNSPHIKQFQGGRLRYFQGHFECNVGTDGLRLNEAKLDFAVHTTVVSHILQYIRVRAKRPRSCSDQAAQTNLPDNPHSKEAHTLQLANDIKYDLSSAVFICNKARDLRFDKQIKASSTQFDQRCLEARNTVNLDASTAAEPLKLS